MRVTKTSIPMSSALVAGTTTRLVFEGLRALDLNAIYPEEPPTSHTLVLAGIITSAANGFLLAPRLRTK